MDELHRFQPNVLLGQIEAVDLKARQMRIAFPDGFEVLGVHVQPDDSCSNLGVDVIESISASDSQHCDG